MVQEEIPLMVGQFWKSCFFLIFGVRTLMDVYGLYMYALETWYMLLELGIWSWDMVYGLGTWYIVS